MKSDAQTTSSSRPSAGATVAAVAETPGAVALVAETPVTEAPVDEALGAEAPVAPSSTPAPIGDGQSWAEQMEAGEDEVFQRSRPAKCPWSQSRRCEPKTPLPFPLQDSEGRLASVLQLYEHAAVQPATPHNVASQGIMHLHPEMLLQKATHLGNQVACMITEYHLMSSARGPSSLSPILPVDTAALLLPIKSYIPSVAFEGTRNMRVMD